MSAAPSFIRIVNWEKYQHYKDRNPPWIKLHRDLMTSETWVSSSNDDRVLAVAIMMLAAATGNLIPANPRYIQRVAYLDKVPDFANLVSLNFIEFQCDNDVALADASTMLADARPETETETDKEKNIKAPKSSPPPKPDCVSDGAWNDFLALRRAKRAPLTETALRNIRAEADKARWPLENALSECVTRGWQAFKAEWVGGRPAGQPAIPV